MSTPHTPWRVCSTHAIFEADTARVWPLLADFNGLPKLIPGMVVSSSVAGEGVGMVRSLASMDGTTIQETLIGFHPELFRLTYAMQDSSPFPWEHYFCSMQLQALGAGQTHFLATGYFQSAEGNNAGAQGILRDVYLAVIEGIGRVLDVRPALQTQ